MLPKIRLGKRSTLGALVSTTCPSEGGDHQEGGGGVTPVTTAMRAAATVGQIKLHPGQKVYVHCGHRECPGLVEQHNHVDNQVSVFLPDLGQHILRKTEDVWTSPSAQFFPSPSPSTSTCPTSANPGERARAVSSCIDVPRRSAEEVDMDEMMAAMVLTSLSFSPLLHSPKHTDTPAALGMECAGGELSDSGSSGYWSVGHSNGSPAPSPPITEADSGLATLSDEGLDMELEQVLFEEPAPRKRKNSMQVAYRCLWPTCGKILTSVVGIKRHVRTMHLGASGEHERCSRSEEDFYYTEIHQREQQAHTPPPAQLSFSPVPPLCAPWLARSTPHPNRTPLGDGVPPGPAVGELGDGDPQASLLSKSAPSGSGSSLWQVQSEHSYQAPPPAHEATPAPCSSASHCWTTTPTTTTSSLHSKQGAGTPFRGRSVSVGEQWHQQHSAPTRTTPTSASPPRCHWPTRRVRGEAKKCRKVYGIEHRDQWCTACRWKKACQRFID
ncbi:Zinc finger protein 395 [Merluccius polli]|uniref:Zinc finger protein 395 n=1 Tax=Merluccius polli TaxID=89951 RepID=A0AA47MJJ3_MERPO|nr:Zinc finger protein 395 [Merluccius polli]